jgi:hypothetical protein
LSSARSTCATFTGSPEPSSGCVQTQPSFTYASRVLSGESWTEPPKLSCSPVISRRAPVFVDRMTVFCGS